MQMQEEKIRVWDLPTRLFHWLLVVAAVGLLVTGRIGGDAMQWHAWLGYTVATLLLFRLAWGFCGGHWSRFSSFPPSLVKTREFLRGAPAGPGHNPLAAWSVYAMLAFLLVQVASGLGSETKEEFAGPLVASLSNATVHMLTGYHKNVGQLILVALVLLHVIAVAVYWLRGRNLVNAMVTGDAACVPGTAASRDDAATRWRGLFVFIGCAAAVAALLKLVG